LKSPWRCDALKNKNATKKPRKKNEEKTRGERGEEEEEGERGEVKKKKVDEGKKATDIRCQVISNNSTR
jgi:hypothetical protein